MKNVAIITAGGTGERLPGECKKQFRPIAGRPLLAYAIDNFYRHNKINNIIVTVPEDDLEEAITLLIPLFPESDVTVTAGGKTRQQSVLRALNIVSEKTDLVLIHDGVRPFADANDITDMVCLCHEVNAVIPVSRVKNTIKEIAENRVVRTVPREELVEVYTPQIFRYDLIVKYHRLAEQQGMHFTDDAAVLEHYGIPVYVYETKKLNIKTTDRNDFEIVKLLIDRDGSPA